MSKKTRAQIAAKKDETRQRNDSTNPMHDSSGSGSDGEGSDADEIRRSSERRRSSVMAAEAHGVLEDHAKGKAHGVVGNDVEAGHGDLGSVSGRRASSRGPRGEFC